LPIRLQLFQAQVLLQRLYERFDYNTSSYCLSRAENI
jgi:hypothetical protein